MSEAKMEHYSRAIDEIYRLRGLLAYEARITEVHLGYKTFPESRRRVAESQVERMRLAARGRSDMASAPISSQGIKSCLVAAGADECLTRTQWEAEARKAIADFLATPSSQRPWIVGRPTGESGQRCRWQPVRDGESGQLRGYIERCSGPTSTGGSEVFGWDLFTVHGKKLGYRSGQADAAEAVWKRKED